MLISGQLAGIRGLLTLWGNVHREITISTKLPRDAEKDFSQSGPHQGRSRCDESVCSYSRQLRLSWRVAVLRVPKLRVRRGLALNRVLQPSRPRIRYCSSKIKRTMR